MGDRVKNLKKKLENEIRKNVDLEREFPPLKGNISNNQILNGRSEDAIENSGAPLDMSNTKPLSVSTKNLTSSRNSSNYYNNNKSHSHNINNRPNNQNLTNLYQNDRSSSQANSPSGIMISKSIDNRHISRETQNNTNNFPANIQIKTPKLSNRTSPNILMDQNSQGTRQKIGQKSRHYSNEGMDNNNKENFINGSEMSLHNQNQSFFKSLEAADEEVNMISRGLQGKETYSRQHYSSRRDSMHTPSNVSNYSGTKSDLQRDQNFSPVSNQNNNPHYLNKNLQRPSSTGAGSTSSYSNANKPTSSLKKPLLKETNNLLQIAGNLNSSTPSRKREDTLQDGSAALNVKNNGSLSAGWELIDQTGLQNNQNNNGRYLNNNSGVEQRNQNNTNKNNPQFAAQPNIRIPSGASPLPSTTLLPSPISHGLPMKNLSQIFNKSLGEPNASTKFGNPNSSVVSNNNNSGNL